MAVASFVATVTAPFAEGAQGLYNALVAWLVAHPAVHIIDIDTFRFESPHLADEQRIRILYETGKTIPGGWQALFYRSSTTVSGSSAQDQFTAAMGAGATFVPWFVLDVTHHALGRDSSDSFIVLGVNTASDPFEFNSKNIYIAEAQAPILAGAAGLANIYDGSGTLIGVLSITVLGTSAWQANERNYAVVDEDSGLLVGLPTCSVAPVAFVPPAITTTTPFPCPAYFAQTTPNLTPLA